MKPATRWLPRTVSTLTLSTRSALCRVAGLRLVTPCNYRVKTSSCSRAVRSWTASAACWVVVRLRRAAALFGCIRFAFRFGRASIFPLAQQPVNDSECDYRETQRDNSQRGCRLHIEDDEFSCERQNADEYHRLDLYDAVKALHGLEDAVIEFHGN